MNIHKFQRLKKKSQLLPVKEDDDFDEGLLTNEEISLMKESEKIKKQNQGKKEWRVKSDLIMEEY